MRSCLKNKGGAVALTETNVQAGNENRIVEQVELSRLGTCVLGETAALIPAAADIELEQEARGILVRAASRITVLPWKERSRGMIDTPPSGSYWRVDGASTQSMKA
jgi:hypothetical protein